MSCVRLMLEPEVLVCVCVCVFGVEKGEKLSMQWVLLNVKVILFNRISIPTLSYNNIRT
jgi:hypothetical protein